MAVFRGPVRRRGTARWLAICLSLVLTPLSGALPQAAADPGGTVTLATGAAAPDVLVAGRLTDDGGVLARTRDGRTVWQAVDGRRTALPLVPDGACRTMAIGPSGNGQLWWHDLSTSESGFGNRALGTALPDGWLDAAAPGQPPGQLRVRVVARTGNSSQVDYPDGVVLCGRAGFAMIEGFPDAQTILHYSSDLTRWSEVARQQGYWLEPYDVTGGGILYYDFLDDYRVRFAKPGTPTQQLAYREHPDRIDAAALTATDLYYVAGKFSDPCSTMTRRSLGTGVETTLPGPALCNTFTSATMRNTAAGVRLFTQGRTYDVSPQGITPRYELPTGPAARSVTQSAGRVTWLDGRGGAPASVWTRPVGGPAKPTVGVEARVASAARVDVQADGRRTSFVAGPTPELVVTTSSGSSRFPVPSGIQPTTMVGHRIMLCHVFALDRGDRSAGRVADRCVVPVRSDRRRHPGLGVGLGVTESVRGRVEEPPDGCRRRPVRGVAGCHGGDVGVGLWESGLGARAGHGAAGAGL
jgi:hypothetical protein